jgi:large subunit ribosomal protein L23
MMHSHLRKVLKKLIVTEKTSMLDRTYAFEVDTVATKKTVKDAVQTLFNVTVESVRTCVAKITVRHPGRKQTSQKLMKKAYVKVLSGHEISLENLDK